VQTGFVWLGIRNNYGAGKRGNETANFILGGGRTDQIHSDETHISGYYTVLTVGRDSVGGMATDCIVRGLNPGGGEIFRTRPGWP